MQQPALQTKPAPRFFRPRRLTHANTFVADVDRTMDFYTKIAGLEETYRVPGKGGGFVGNGNTHHDMGFLYIGGAFGFRARAGKPDLYHLGFELETETDLVKGYEQAKAAGVALRPADHDIAHSLYATAPNGFLSEIYADVVKEWRKQRSGNVTKPTGTWTPGSTPPVDEPQYHAKPEIRRVEAAVFHPQTTSHVVLACDKYDEVVAHFTDIVGMEIVSGGARANHCALAGTLGQVGLCLFRVHDGRHEGVHHIGFAVADEADLRASIDRLAAVGLRPEFVIDHPARLAVYLRDPDGILLQFHHDRADVPAAIAALDDDMAVLLS